MEKESSMKARGSSHERHRSMPRDPEQIKQLKNRLSRMTGQLNGIGRMLDDNRYCGDILMQVAAVESALQNFGYIVLQTHMESCVAEELREGNPEIMAETMDLIKKLK
jgi:DNA-binding FrmR family transcriptional regulator